MTVLTRFIRQLPVIHLAAVVICTVILGIIFFFMPDDSSREDTSLSPHSGQIISDSSPDPLAEQLPNGSSDDKPEEPALLDQAAALPSHPMTAPSSDTSPPVLENWVEYQIQPGDNLTTLFKRAGLGPRDVYRVSSAVSGTDALRKLRPGEQIALLIEDGQLTQLRHIRSRLNSTRLVQTEQGYQVIEEERTPERQLAHAQGNIENSLFLDAASAGLSDKLIMELAAIFGWDVDFALDIRRGDSFQVLYEEKYLDGEKIGDGPILAARFTNRGKAYEAVRYIDSKGEANYYTPEGRSMRKAFLRSPVDFRRISSRFKPERYHPVLGRKRPHRGVDYAAATGTPIKAAGDGKVIWRGTKGGYGRTVIIQHGGNIATLYAHMSRYRRGVNKGSRVRQGDIIGYVGASGLATGPHLHYEFRINGVHKDPLTVALPRAESVPAAEMDAFQRQTGNLMAELNQRTQTQLALSGPANDKP